MTQRQQIYHKSLIKALHISRRYKEYFKDNKDEYTELLQESFGVNSSKELTINQLILFVDYMNFKDVKLPTYEKRSDEFGATCTKPQLEMMKGLWNGFATNKTDEALLKFANRQAGKTYLHLHMLSKQEAQKIIPVHH
ncbi:phage protein GemA/Gp16 family protein [Sulfurimonas sp.]|uniref:phage protein GemA/Gp16 family protein n=1 Tax=Sulfurimonas sp. TaxID=2022749 RepID=UPI0025D72D67|nr:phage protein GemA/Gp16 family protein [Sulfurimonas sp.]